MSRELQGGCQAPIGGYAVMENGRLRLTGFVADLEGQRFYRTEVTGSAADPEAVGHTAAADLIRQGADRLLAEIVHRGA